MAAPVRDTVSLQMLARHLKRRPHTVAQIMEIFDLTKRSAYRWLDYLKDDGHDVIKRNKGGVAYYSILSS